MRIVIAMEEMTLWETLFSEDPTCTGTGALLLLALMMDQIFPVVGSAFPAQIRCWCLVLLRLRVERNKEDKPNTITLAVMISWNKQLALVIPDKISVWLSIEVNSAIVVKKA